MKYGLLGYPLGHSLSPEIHRLLFSLAGKPEHQYSMPGKHRKIFPMYWS